MFATMGSADQAPELACSVALKRAISVLKNKNNREAASPVETLNQSGRSDPCELKGHGSSPARQQAQGWSLGSCLFEEDASSGFFIGPAR